ncbi:MAG TPA: sigma-70 family RNA polymerase sigma factor [Dehalococcoidia bacterium]|nr:sigma-70 family RNA polymerase sigma factor [Dehalococcoidia bacterium]
MELTLSGPTGRENLTEAQLVLLARQRDAATWSEIYVQHYTRVYRYIYGYLGSKEEAEDLAAQVFLEAIQNIDSYHDRGRPLLAWLFGIAKNLIRGRAKRVRRNLEAIANQTAELQRTPSSQGGISPEMMDILKGLNSLTGEQRETLVLRFLTGLTAKETGLVMGKTEYAVYALQVRGLATLRRLMSEPTAVRDSIDGKAVA